MLVVWLACRQTFGEFHEFSYFLDRNMNGAKKGIVKEEYENRKSDNLTKNDFIMTPSASMVGEAMTLSDSPTNSEVLKQQQASSGLSSDLTNQSFFAGPARISYYSSQHDIPPLQRAKLSLSKSPSIKSSSSLSEKYYDIHFNDPEFHPSKRFPSNYVRTTKYTILTFLPLNLFHQVSFRGVDPKNL